MKNLSDALLRGVEGALSSWNTRRKFILRKEIINEQGSWVIRIGCPGVPQDQIQVSWSVEHHAIFFNISGDLDQVPIDVEEGAPDLDGVSMTYSDGLLVVVVPTKSEEKQLTPIKWKKK